MIVHENVRPALLMPIKATPYALLWLEEAVKEENSYAEYLLGKTLLKGEDTEQDIDRAVRLLTSSAEQKNCCAQYTLGKAYLEGMLLLQNIPEAVRLLTESAESGFSSAEYLLGKLLYHGEVVGQDISKALLYLERAAEKENACAAYLAGKIRLTEDGYMDVQKAIRLFQIAAAQGNHYAEYQLGLIYLRGKDIVDNTQLTIFGGFAPQSTSAETLSKALGSRTVMSGSVSRSKNDPSESLQMIERPLMTPDELKSMPKGQFVVMKTGFYPMKVKLKLFFKWGIHFDEEHPYTVSDQGNREVKYASKKDITDGIIKKYHPELLEPAAPQNDESSSGGQNQQMTEHHQPASMEKNDEKDKNGGAALQTVPKNRRTPLSQPPKNTEVTSDGQT